MGGVDHILGLHCGWATILVSRRGDIVWKTWTHSGPWRNQGARCERDTSLGKLCSFKTVRLLSQMLMLISEPGSLSFSGK